jgi:hypothetical protein
VSAPCQDEEERHHRKGEVYWAAADGSDPAQKSHQDEQEGERASASPQNRPVLVAVPQQHDQRDTEEG